jgi:ParB family chromosome partitioning protein
VPTAFLRPNKFQPRKTFVDDDLNDLIASVKDKGILQPLLVRPVAGEPNTYEIVAGERRWRAAQAAKLHEVPVIVRELTDGQALEYAIIENVQRSDLNAIEEAAAYQELMDRFSYTQEKMADAVGKSRPHVANTLRLLKLPESVRVLVRDGKLAPGAARTLIGDPDAEARALEIVAGGLNVRQAEQRSKDTKTGKKPVHKLVAEDPNIKELEVSLANILGLKVQIVDKGEAGEVRVFYKTLEQLDDLVLRLKKF